MSVDDEKLLLQEYAHFGDAIFKNEEIGERRVQFFVTIATAVLGGVALLYTSDHPKLPPETIHKIAVAALLSLFLRGLVTFARILQRDHVTAEYKGIQRYLREQLRTRSASLQEYALPFRDPRHKLLRGGIAITTAVINSLVLAFLIGIWTRDNPKSTLLIIDGFLWSFVLHAVAIGGKTVPRERSQTYRAGAGAVILNSQGLVLAMKRKNIPGAWQLPQGGLKIGESPREAALREICEETGIREKDLQELPLEPVLLAYDLPPEYRSEKTGRGQVHHWFLFRYTGPDSGISLGDGKEFEARKWTSLHQLASEVVPFRQEVYRELLRRWSSELAQ